MVSCFGRGQQDRRHKHAKTGDGGKPAIPKTERQNDKRRARESKKNAEGHPGLGVAADVKKLGDQEYGANRAPISKLRKRAVVPSCGDAAVAGAVLILLPYVMYLLRVRGGGSRFQRIYLAHAGKGAADVRNGDGAADDQSHV